MFVPSVTVPAVPPKTAVLMPLLSQGTLATLRPSHQLREVVSQVPVPPKLPKALMPLGCPPLASQKKVAACDFAGPKNAPSAGSKLRMEPARIARRLEKGSRVRRAVLRRFREGLER